MTYFFFPLEEGVPLAAYFLAMYEGQKEYHAPCVGTSTPETTLASFLFEKVH